ncbi:MAG: hypothetical protein F4099_00605 [Synechococcus sp. SB0673_bin_10]|nr:hypothetical protein [Synechococcus sp. SB0675_bin_7]MYI71029.1 hypothetical protein [Synechococcus sp. SB0673_bin_10]
MDMDLLTNPFLRLGATMGDNRGRVMALAEEKSLAADEATAAAVQDAKAVLIHPKRRLKAEIGYLPGLEPQQASEMIATVQQNPINIRNLVAHLPSLARANLLAAGLIRVAGRLPKDEVAQWILALAHGHEAIAARPTAALLNGERSAAGFPAVTDLQTVDAELRSQRQYYGQAIKKVLDQLSFQSLVEVVTTTVDKATNHGKNHAPILIDDLVDRFEVEVEVQGFFETQTKKIKDLVQRIRHLAQENKGHRQINFHASKLENVVRNWDRVAQPIQVSARSRGTDHDLSHEIAAEIRSLVFYLLEKHDLLDISKRLTALQQEIFAELDTVVEKLNEDAIVLNKISKLKSEVSKLKSEIFKKKLLTLLFRSFRLLFWPFIVLLLIGLISLLQDNRKTNTISSYTQSPPSVPSSPSRTLEVQVPSPELKFSKPPVGDDNILSIAQIRWCLREEIRIEVLRPRVTTNPQIDQFNTIVDNYNRCCASYRYYESTLERAQREVEKTRSQIIADASLWSPFVDSLSNDLRQE